MNFCKNSVFIATSLDGYIADKNGSLNWLTAIPNPDNNNMGYSTFIEKVDAILMGRKTFETIVNFGIEWPYKKPVFVLSKTLKSIDKPDKNKVKLINGPLKSIVKILNQQGFRRLYIDGGTTIQNFLNEDLIDELIITTIPVLLGGGNKLFADLQNELWFEHVDTKVYFKNIVQSHYERKKD